ncbi:hypothetical protein PLEOSDRAFT_1106939 [Pleurotus ostreatus PC15]|uniref:Uncharacterized protein n=1 Tax=Pleurotus ostreatus (strain PC15) TaxID=1137138 RepID=A0A067NDF2_PLEO1|nr:hypothetical protein PLEOSDRAFT_1106939 [Pleurotus ostreatus PC15]
MKCLQRITVSTVKVGTAIHGFALGRQKHTGRRLKGPARTEQLDTMLAFSGLAIPKKHVQLPASSQRTRRSGAIAQQVRALAQKGHYKSVDEILHTLDRAPRGYSPLPDDGMQVVTIPPSNASVRFPSHVFMHQLLRDNKPVRAARKLEWMIEGGVRVRTRTFNAITSALLSKMPKFTVKEPDKANEGNTGTQRLDETAVARPFTSDRIRETFCRQAVALLQLARTHGVKREMWMYERVIDGLMLQEQYVEAALLFDMLAKDWQVQRALEEAFCTPVSPLPQITSQPKQTKLYTLLTILAASSLPPSSSLLRRILKPVTEMFGRIKTFRYLPTHAVHSSLQAYVILLTTLHQRQIPFADISLLSEAVSTCPVNSRVQKNPVWVVRQEGGPPRKVDALTYADEVLEALINDLPKDLPTFPALEVSYDRSDDAANKDGRAGIPLRKLFKESAITDIPFASSPTHQRPPTELRLPYLPPILPPLDEASYLSLMTYALYVRQDTSLARTVFVHMIAIRNPALTPGPPVWTTLQNAVIGSATLGEPRSKGESRSSWRTGAHMNLERVDEILSRVVTSEEKDRMFSLSDEMSQAGGTTSNVPSSH